MSDSPDRPQRVFALRYIPRAVAEVCTYANPGDPMAVSRPRFNAMREKAGWGNCPTAKALCSRTEKTWAELKRHALDGDLDLSRSAGARGYMRSEFTGDQVAHALRLVHAMLARATNTDPNAYVMSRDDYDAQVIVLGARRGRSRMHLPNVSHVERLLEMTFTEALDAVGLPTPEAPEPVTPAEFWQVAELFLEAYGSLPNYEAMVTFAEVNAIGTAGYKRSWPLELAELRSRRDARGLWTPPRPLPKDTRPNPSTPTGIDYGFPRRVSRRWKPEEVIEEACEFLRWIDSTESPPGARPTKTMWRMWANQDPSRLPIGAPARANGGFAGTIAIASDRLLPEHLREFAEDTEWQAGHQELRAIVLEGTKPDLLMILSLVEQHGPLTRLQLAGAMDMSVEKVEKRVRRLEGLGGLQVVDPLPQDHWRTSERLALGSAVVGAVAGALGAIDPVPAPPDATGRLRARLTDDDLAALEGCRRIADAEGFIQREDLTADLGISRELTYHRIRRLIQFGALIREEVTEATREKKGQQYRWRLAESADQDEPEAA